jgi:hypothetical protein
MGPFFHRRMPLEPHLRSLFRTLRRLTLLGALGGVGMSLAAQSSMIWPTGIGTFLVKRGPASEWPGARERAEAGAAVSAPGRSSGYLASGAARPLRWDQPVDAATSTLVLRFETEDDKSETARRALIASAAEAREMRLEESALRSLMVMEEPPRVELVSASPPEPVPMPEEASEPPARGGVLDEQFVNWVTRRIGETKVEIPFQLPTEATEGDRVAPTERVRVRYRVEP